PHRRHQPDRSALWLHRTLPPGRDAGRLHGAVSGCGGRAMLVSSLAMTHDTETGRAITSVWKIEQPRLIAGLTRMVRDISLAEELAQDALLIALKAWPESGVPNNPGAWLMQTAKRRGIDYFRHRKMAATKLEEVGRLIEDDTPDHESELVEALDDEVGDDLLRLIFTACHPILPAESRVALTLLLLGGLTTEEIARAFLAAEPTIGQRIVRAKRTIAEAGIPFE